MEVFDSRSLEDQVIENELRETVNNGLQTICPQRRWMQVVSARFLDGKTVSQVKEEMKIDAIYATHKGLLELKKKLRGAGFIE